MKPKISIIVPVLNRAELIIRCLESIKNQSLLPYELIVVDNGSTDETVANVTRWMLANGTTGIKLHILEESVKGACAARRKGLNNAHGNYVIFFDSDDEMRKDLIKTASDAVENDNDIDIVCWKCKLHLLNGKTKVPTFNVSNPIENHLIHALLRPQGYMVRKDFLIKAGGWQKNIAVWNDYELGLRLLLSNPKIKGIKKILADIYSQEDSITGKKFSDKEGKWEQTILEMRRTNELSKHPAKERISRILDYREIILAAHYSKEGKTESGEKLLEDTIKRAGQNPTLFKFIYNYTRKGGRGAWLLCNHLI